MQPLRISQKSDLAQSLSRNNSPPPSLTNLENSKRTSQAKWTCQVFVIMSHHKHFLNVFFLNQDMYLRKLAKIIKMCNVWYTK